MSKIVIDIPQIAQKIKALELSAFDLVIGIATGGILPASLLAFELELELKIIQINFRAEDNSKRYSKPRLLKEFIFLKRYKNILLVDDVSVSGQTFAKAKEIINHKNITTLAIKGKADIVLFENISSCIILPWRDY